MHHDLARQARFRSSSAFGPQFVGPGPSDRESLAGERYARTDALGVLPGGGDQFDDPLEDLGERYARSVDELGKAVQATQFPGPLVKLAGTLPERTFCSLEAQQGLHAGQQQPAGDRAHEPVIHADLQAAVPPVRCVIVRDHQEDIGTGPIRAGLDAPVHLRAIHVPQNGVEQHHVRVLLAHQPQALAARSRLQDPVAGLAQQARTGTQEVFIVVYNQDLGALLHGVRLALSA